MDEAVREACDRGDYRAAAARAFEEFGPSILSFLGARMRSDVATQDVFSMFAEDLWRGLPGFDFRCSMRTWLYLLARNAANRYAVTPHNRQARHVPAEPFVEGLVAHVRTTTQVHFQTEIKNQVRALRERLDEDDQTLLILHVDRGLPFRELAQVLRGDLLQGTELTREMAKLRKRFERVKTQLRELARSEGLLVETRDG
jgi:RNA polymerase sigma-70 factor (ECF subfamily)